MKEEYTSEIIYKEFAQSPRPISATVYYAGHEHCKKSHIHQGIRNHFLLHYVENGRGRVRIGKKYFDLDAGDSFLYYPEDRLYYRASADRPWTYSWFGFGPDTIGEILAELEITESSVIMADFRPETAVLFRNIIKTLAEKKPGYSFAAAGYLHLVLSSLSEFQNLSSKRTQRGENIDHCARVKDFIHQNYGQDISVATIAGVLNLHHAYLSGLFRRKNGETIRDYLIRYRMQKACMLLRKTELNIGEISASVGYRNYQSFEKCFKRRQGISPRDFRRNIE